MLKITNAAFIKSAVKVKDYPPLNDNEFAFFGRSNVGKSSLINFILNRKNLVKVGATPGKTQTVNFFSIEALSSTMNAKKVKFVLTDLPGYGYAKLNKQTVKILDSMLYEYCTNRPIKKMFFLFDIRRNAGESELKTLQFFKEQKIETHIVITKIDKIAKTFVKKRLSELASSFSVNESSLLPTSTLKGYGKDSLLAIIEKDCIERDITEKKISSKGDE